MTEEWREVTGVEGLEASSAGRVRRRDGVVLSPRIGSHGYEILYHNRRQHLVHRLVLGAFAGPPPSAKMHGCHNDGNQRNNRIENLRWDTPTANHQDAKRHGTYRQTWHKGMRHNAGESHGLAKFTDDVVRMVRRSRAPGVEWARRLEVSKSSIAHIRNGARWPHLGEVRQRWEYWTWSTWTAWCERNPDHAALSNEAFAELTQRESP